MTGPTGPSKTNMQEFSRSSGMPQPELHYLAIGKIIRAHGLRGEVSVVVLTEFPERFETTEWVYLGDQFEAVSYRLESFRWHKKNVLLTLAGVTDRTQAEALQGQFVQVPIEEAVPLPEDAYYFHQLIGLAAITTTGQRLGVVTDIMETGANDVYVIEGDSQEILLPAIADVVKLIDLDKGHMIIEVIDGLI